MWLVPLAVGGTVVAAAAVIFAQVLLVWPVTAPFFATYPGITTLPVDAPVGFPAWLSWSHFLNAFFLVFIVRSGLYIRSKQRPPAFVTRTAGPLASRARRQSLHVWWHIVIDTLFVVNGVVYVVLLIVSGQWVRIVPLGWDVIPNAVSAGVQYVSLAWPVHDGWVHYNALQLLSYFATVFIAGPLALVTGLRLSPAWPSGARWHGLNRVVTEARARAVHVGVLVYFVLFTIVHVGLVFATGALQNLNHMYAGRDDATWIGAAVFGVSLAVTVAAFVALRPRAQAFLAQLGNDVRRMPPAPRRQPR